MTVQTNASIAGPDTPPTMPVAALPYHRDDGTAFSLETKLVVLAAALHGAFGLLSFATYVWIYLQPGYFRTVGSGFRSVGSFQFAFAVLHALTSVLLVAGAAAFYARRPACRPLLLSGAAGLLLGMVAGFAYSLLFSSTGAVMATAADRVAMSVWQGASLVSMGLLPVLLLVAMSRPSAKAIFKKPG